MGKKIKKVLSFMLIFVLTLGSLMSSFKVDVKAAQDAAVIVNGISGTLFTGTSSSTDPIAALKEITSGQVTDSKGYVSGIGGLNEKEYSPSSGWMYSVYRNGEYISSYPLTLQSGDVLVYYFGDSNTLFPNNVLLSTNAPDTPLTITINNIDYNNKTNPINDALVKIDDAEVKMDGNKVTLPSGLHEGTHKINISGYKTDAVPDVAEASYTVNISYPKIKTEIYGLNGKIAEGDVSLNASAKTALDALKLFLDSKKISYTVLSESYGELVTEINGIKNSPNHDGWQYYVKKSDKVISPMVGIGSYNLDDNDTLVMYYGDMNTKYLYSIKFSPEIVKPNESFSAQFIGQNGEPLQNTDIKIDEKTYTTDNYGKITASLGSGSHNYSISFKKDGDIPDVIESSGSFMVDGVHSPNFNYASSNTEKPEDRDNSGIKPDMAAEIKATSPVVLKNGNDSYSAMSMKALGLKGNSSFLQDYKTDIEKYGAGDYSNTDLENLILGITALGYSPYSFGGTDLVKTLLSRDVSTFYINDLIFALNVYNYVKPAGSYKITRGALIDKIIEKKITYKDKNYNDIYGFNLAYDKVSPSIDVDITAMSISALAPYYNEAKVKNVIDKSINSLKLMENSSGYIIGTYGASAETQSAVIMALTAVGIDPRGEDFSKVKGDLITALLSFKGTSGFFKHTLNGSNDAIATEQSLRALISYYNFIKKGSYNYYLGSTNPADKENTLLPKTGSPVDFSVLMLSGLIIVLLGCYILRKRENCARKVIN